ncbi:MAG: hypothetical protein HYY84_14715 [Deltaproteobacteria bacterium]|nr:hypothetical protein [Deltaproteobacteria bacterium]
MAKNATSDGEWSGGDHHAVWRRLTYRERLEWLERAQAFASQFLGAAQRRKSEKAVPLQSTKKIETP